MRRFLFKFSLIAMVMITVFCAYLIGYKRGWLDADIWGAVGDIKAGVRRHEYLQQQKYSLLEGDFRNQIDAGMFHYQMVNKCLLGFGLAGQYETNESFLAAQQKAGDILASPKLSGSPYTGSAGDDAK